MSMTRRSFLAAAGAYGAMGAFGPSLWAAMKYDRDAVLKRFRLHSADTDASVKAGIEANRKGPMLFTFKDAAGKTLENVHVKVVQKTHDFKYGADIFMLDEIGDSKEKNEAYKEHFAAAFNLATVPFYWKDLEPEEGKTRYAKGSPKIYRRPPPDLCVEWCESHGIEPKAHCLNYSSQSPDWATGDIQKEKYLLEKRFRELAERYAKRIPMWEVTNETFWGKDHQKANFYREPDFVEWSFKLAERCFPANHLVINEWSNLWGDTWNHRSRGRYYMQIERAMLKGARIDGVGMQFHMFFDAEKAVSILAEKVREGKRIRIIGDYDVATRKCRRRYCASYTASGSRILRWRRSYTGTSPTAMPGARNRETWRQARTATTEGSAAST